MCLLTSLLSVPSVACSFSIDLRRAWRHAARFSALLDHFGCCKKNQQQTAEEKNQKQMKREKKKYGWIYRSKLDNHIIQMRSNRSELHCQIDKASQPSAVLAEIPKKKKYMGRYPYFGIQSDFNGLIRIYFWFDCFSL